MELMFYRQKQNKYVSCSTVRRVFCREKQRRKEGRKGRDGLGVHTFREMVRGGLETGVHRNST